MTKRVLFAAVLLAAALVTRSPAMAQSFSPFSDFLALSDAQLTSLQVKLTFGGIQEEGIPSVVFATSAAAVNVAQFTPFHRPTFPYQNDAAPKIVIASTSELRLLLQNASSIPSASAGGVDSLPYLSFSMVFSNPGVAKGFESILSPAHGTTLLGAFRSAFAGDAASLSVINDFGCIAALRDPMPPADVSNSVSVALSGLRLNRSTGRFVGTATLQNTGSSAVPIPLSLVVILPSTVSLFNASGATCGVGPVGQPYIDSALTAPMQPSESVQIKLEFVNPGSIPVTATTKVLAGPGGR